MPLLYLSVSLLLGIFAGSIISVPLWLPALGLAGLAAALIIRTHRKPIILISLCFMAFTGGMLRYQLSIYTPDSSRLINYNDNGTVTLEGLVTDAPVVKNRAVTFRFSADELTSPEKTCSVSGDALVRVPFYKEIRYGDRLRLTGQPQAPREFDDFDYPSYLADRGIYTVIYYPRLEILERDRGIAPLAWIFTLRDNLGSTLSRSLTEPQASLAQAILLGLRANIPEDIMQWFYASGTTHLLAISGLNLTIILGMTLAASAWLFGRRYKIYIWLSLALIWIYALLTGLPATVVRAAIMGSVFLLAEMLGRQRNAVAALSLAAAMMALASPRILWDASFQLSFLSMLGLIYVAPYLLFEKEEADADGQTPLLRVKKIVTIGFGVALAAVLATWPVIAVYFKTFSAVSIPATFFAMPALPAIIVTAALSAFSGLVWLPLGILFGWIAWLFISLFMLVIRAFSSIPFAYITHLEISAWQAAVYYIVLILLLLFAGFRRKIADKTRSLVTAATRNSSRIRDRISRIQPAWLIVPLVIANLLTWLAVISQPDGKLHVYILDVGQGESILIRTPAGHNVLVDTGPDPKVILAQLGKNLPFWDRQIDLLILTQPQSDHNAGAIELLRNYHVKKIGMPPLPSHSEFTRLLDREMMLKGLAPLSIYEGKSIALEQDIKILVLNPPATLLPGSPGDINNNTAVLRVEWNRVSFLLTSDIENEAERHLVANRSSLRSDVLKVAHHGSRGSTGDDFLAVVRPTAAVISAGLIRRLSLSANMV